MRDSLIALTLSYSVSGQVYDNFSDGNFTKTQLGVATQQLKNSCCELTVKLTFNPSNSNYVDWYLVANDSIFINEILFNPKIGGYDYVELYNASNTYIDLSKLLIGNYDTLLNDIVNTKKICEKYPFRTPYVFSIV